MNKLISVKQKEKNVEQYDDWEDYFEEEEMHSESIYDEKMQNFSRNVEINCQNEKCINVVEEINKLTEECMNLDKKCLLIDYVKSEQLFEISEKISEICKNINSLIDKVEIYEGEGLEKLDYDSLTQLEMHLIKFYKKVKLKISEVNNFNLFRKNQGY
jgi:hypothetical protein